MHWILVNTPSKRDFPKISENGLSEKYFDFTSWYLLNRIYTTDKKPCFRPTLTKNISHLMAIQTCLRPIIWKYDAFRWIWVEKKIWNRKLLKS